MDIRFPHSADFTIGDETFTPEQIVEGLAPHMTDHRRELLAEVVARRTYSVVPVLDGIYDRGNTSAVFRSAEALGYQKVHVIESHEGFKAANRVTQGADKWLDVKKWDTIEPCLAELQRQEYQIVATYLGATKPIHEVDFTRPTAIIFGNERDGVSQATLDAADETVIIPMKGFVESLNISVAAAIALFHVMQARDSAGGHSDLTDDQIRVLLASYYLRSYENHADVLLHKRARGDV
jgi:tRNA (guanosine-2'-O-)-methyltransferase